jgi:ABC-type Zn uptake system ZnuABC Zn-binding protein ZnuA
MYTSEGAADLLITNGLHPEEEIDRVITSFNKIINIKKNRYEFI